MIEDFETDSLFSLSRKNAFSRKACGVCGSLHKQSLMSLGAGFGERGKVFAKNLAVAEYQRMRIEQKT